VIEKGKDALVVVEHEDPVEHFSRGVDDTDSLGKDLGASDLSVEPAFVVVRRVIDQPGLEAALSPENLRSRDQLDQAVYEGAGFPR
jgi:hypothetical protein